MGQLPENCSQVIRSVKSWLTCFHSGVVVSLSSPAHIAGEAFLKTLASWCSLRLLQVCSNLAAKTMRKGRNHPRNHPRNHTIGELQVNKAGAIIFPYTLPCSAPQL
jgi:hypothetical protein